MMPKHQQSPPPHRWLHIELVADFRMPACEAVELLCLGFENSRFVINFKGIWGRVVVAIPYHPGSIPHRKPPLCHWDWAVSVLTTQDTPGRSTERFCASKPKVADELFFVSGRKSWTWCWLSRTSTRPPLPMLSGNSSPSCPAPKLTRTTLCRVSLNVSRNSSSDAIHTAVSEQVGYFFSWSMQDGAGRTHRPAWVELASHCGLRAGRFFWPSVGRWRTMLAEHIGWYGLSSHFMHCAWGLQRLWDPLPTLVLLSPSKLNQGCTCFTFTEPKFSAVRPRLNFGVFMFFCSIKFNVGWLGLDYRFIYYWFLSVSATHHTSTSWKFGLSSTSARLPRERPRLESRRSHHGGLQPDN